MLASEHLIKREGVRESGDNEYNVGKDAEKSLKENRCSNEVRRKFIWRLGAICEGRDRGLKIKNTRVLFVCE